MTKRLTETIEAARHLIASPLLCLFNIFAFNLLYFSNKCSVNVNEGRPESRLMRTGRHIVRDIRCRECNTVLGWKYDKAYEASQKFKEGKFILEMELIVLQSGAAPFSDDTVCSSNGSGPIRYIGRASRAE